MTERRVLIDPAASADPAQLIVEGGEYRHAVAAMACAPALASVPDEVFFHLYACEILERMRERAAEASPEGDDWIIPFWPSALFEANRIVAHAAREIEGMLPARSIEYTARSVADVQVEARRVFGDERLDAGRYVDALTRRAERAGWRRAGGMR